jgi:hypothetical protein
MCQLEYLKYFRDLNGKLRKIKAYTKIKLHQNNKYCSFRVTVYTRVHVSTYKSKDHFRAHILSKIGSPGISRFAFLAF